MVAIKVCFSKKKKCFVKPQPPKPYNSEGGNTEGIGVNLLLKYGG